MVLIGLCLWMKSGKTTVKTTIKNSRTQATPYLGIKYMIYTLVTTKKRQGVSEMPVDGCMVISIPMTMFFMSCYFVEFLYERKNKQEQPRTYKLKRVERRSKTENETTNKEAEDCFDG